MIIFAKFATEIKLNPTPNVNFKRLRINLLGVLEYKPICMTVHFW